MAQRPRGHVREHGKARWRLEVELPPDPVTGRRRRKSRVIDAPNRRAALDAWAAFATEARSGDAPVPADLTVNELLDRWLAHIAGDGAPASLENWTEEFRRYIRPHLGNAAVAKVGPYDLDMLYRRLLVSGGKDGRPLKASTVRKVHSAVRLAFAQAVRWGWISTNPATMADPPRVAKSTPSPPEPAVAERIRIAAARTDPDFADALLLATVTGCRRGELAGLQFRDIDFDGRTVAFHRVVRESGKIVDYPKTSSSRRRIAVGPTTIDALRAIRRRTVERALAAGVALDPAAYVLSPTIDAIRPHRPDVLTTRFQRACELAEVHGVRLHDLRHLMATQALGAGIDVRTVAGRGGWANPTTLLSVYAHWLPARDQAAAELLEGLLEQPSASEA